MQSLTFSDRLYFAPTRSARLWARQSAKSRAARARLLRRCCLAPSAGMGLEALPRQLRSPWQGGHVALARAAGIDRIEPGRAPQISATCSVPSMGFSDLPRFSTAAIAA